MPRKSRKRSKAAKSRRRASYRGRRRQRRGNLRITSRRMPTLFPDQMLVKLQAVTVWAYTTDTTTGGQTFHAYANSIADPMGNLSATIQPTGLDQYSNFYNRYYVFAAKLTLTAFPRPTGSDTGIFHVFPSMEVYSESNWATISLTEQPFVKHCYQFATGGRDGVSRLKSYMTTHKISGGEYEKSNPNNQGVLELGDAIDPTDKWYFIVRARNFTSPTVAITGTAEIRLTQYVALYNRRNIPDSAQ